MKDNLHEQGPALCFELLDKIYGQNHEEEELIWGGLEAKRNFFGLADRLFKQSILLESSFVQQHIFMTKKKNSHGKRNSIWIQ